MSFEDVQAEVFNDHSSGLFLGDFCDGFMYREHPLFTVNDKALQIIGCYDDLEIVNPIGFYVAGLPFFLSS